MYKRDSKLLLEDILESSEKIISYTNNHNFKSFSDDSKTVDAVIRNFEIIGEAANRLPEEFKNQYENVQWFRIIGFRNRIVHDYMGVDLSIVWNIIEEFLPILMKEISLILDML